MSSNGGIKARHTFLKFLMMWFTLEVDDDHVQEVVAK